MFCVRSTSRQVRLPRDRLVLLALRIVRGTADQAQHGIVQPSDALRLALAILYTLSDGPLFDWPDHEAVFVRFWRVVTGLDMECFTQGDYARGTYATTYLHQIERQVRFTEIVERAKADVRKKAASATAGKFVHDEDEAKQDKRRYYWRPLPKPKSE